MVGMFGVHSLAAALSELYRVILMVQKSVRWVYQGALTLIDKMFPTPLCSVGLVIWRGLYPGYLWLFVQPSRRFSGSSNAFYWRFLRNGFLHLLPWLHDRH